MHYSPHKTVFRFTSRSKQKREIKETPKPSVRLSRLMALAIRFEDLLKSGEVADYSELAARYGVDRGRISRIMYLRRLAPDLQEKLLFLKNSKAGLSLKHILPICKFANWQEQRKTFEVSYRQ